MGNGPAKELQGLTVAGFCLSSDRQGPRCALPWAITSRPREYFCPMAVGSSWLAENDRLKGVLLRSYVWLGANGRMRRNVARPASPDDHAAC
jgi:hypothetical protein